MLHLRGPAVRRNSMLMKQFIESLLLFAVKARPDHIVVRGRIRDYSWIELVVVPAAAIDSRV